jgi:hypothetical protein
MQRGPVRDYANSILTRKHENTKAEASSAVNNSAYGQCW